MQVRTRAIIRRNKAVEQLYPLTPMEDLKAIVEETPPWMKVHGALMIDRLEKYLATHGGNRTWKEIKKNSVASQSST